MAQNQQTRINEAIRAREIRVLGSEGENLGTLDTRKALEMAREQNLDLIEISPNANPPIAKIMDYGKFLYDQKKKLKATKAKAHTSETKVVQIKVGTSEHDLELKAKNISKWLKEGNRVKLDLFLSGRSKYMEMDFLKERMSRILHLIIEDFKVADGPKKSPKGLSMTLEKK